MRKLLSFKTTQRGGLVREALLWLFLYSYPCNNTSISSIRWNWACGSMNQCLFYPLGETTSQLRPPWEVAFLEGFHYRDTIITHINLLHQLRLPLKLTELVILHDLENFRLRRFLFRVHKLHEVLACDYREFRLFFRVLCRKTWIKG